MNNKEAELLPYRSTIRGIYYDIVTTQKILCPLHTAATRAGAFKRSQPNRNRNVKTDSKATHATCTEIGVDVRSPQQYTKLGPLILSSVNEVQQNTLECGGSVSLDLKY